MAKPRLVKHLKDTTIVLVSFLCYKGNMDNKRKELDEDIFKEVMKIYKQEQMKVAKKQARALARKKKRDENKRP